MGGNVEIPVAIAFLPGASVLSLLADVLGIPQGVPVTQRRLLRKACPDYVLDVMGPITSAGSLHIPDVLAVAGDLKGDGMRDEIRGIADTPPDFLLAELERTFGGEVPPAWRKAVDNPADFVTAYAGLASAVWDAVAPVWRRAKPLLEREVGRVGVASVTGTMGDFLANLSPRIDFADGNVLLPDSATGREGTAIRKLTLMPLVSGTRACVLHTDGDGHVHLGYPIAGLAPLLQGEAARAETAADALAMMLGELRADILRTGNQPVSMGKLADLLHCTAGTVTYHCRQLEQAGLLSRERRGREVRILRTLRGDALVDALS
ncbi:MarR family transcriptional regulator [Streptomyces albospinus]|uniref:MarR family transcriptional regulator n=1 Tax=Streptomyces albospinus TaxID=285515 RepID=UPI0016701179|nr:MarR family transcriptional regulator [Streptomyces albospinus]